MSKLSACSNTGNKQQKNILLINPKRKYRFNWDLKEVAELMGKKTISHPLALPLLAALTPSIYTVKIIDEEIEPVPRNIKADLIGITALISNINRAYELADHFRKKSIPVIMGGPQVSFEAEKAGEHADYIIIGEAENSWPQFLDDWQNHEAKKTYSSGSFCDFKISPVPRWDLVKTGAIMTYNVQVSRGCPYSCDFCIVRNLSGPRQRYRDLDNVMKEISSLPQTALINFADDNLTANRRYADELLKRLKPLKLSWSCQISIESAYDAAFMKKMAEAGCNSVLIGFETLDPAVLKIINKKHNSVEKYEAAISNIHNAGIFVIASFVVGFDNDTNQVFEKILKFTFKNSISFIMLNALYAYPGSELYFRLKKENRILDINLDTANGIAGNIKYKNISAKQVYLNILKTLEQIYSYKNILKTIPALFSNKNFFRSSEQYIPPFIKLRTVWYFLKHFIFTLNREKRAVLFKLFMLVKNKTVQDSVAVQYLMFIESFNGYLKHCSRTGNKILPFLEY
ncbi:MAG TPA: hypothetical protein DC049_06100 [Spirochaetia bacterium]|nr:hypothetical protein [Spirochaetia bacterium]